MKTSDYELKYLKSIAEMIDDFLKSNAPKFKGDDKLKFMDRCLSHIVPGKTFHTSIIESTMSSNPFIMRVFPDMVELSNKSEELFTAMNAGKADEFFKTWYGIKTYHIEIDSRLLTKGQSICVDDGNQFVAILCHELGHVTFENPKRLLEIYLSCHQIYDKTAIMMMNRNPVVRKLCMPMFLATATFKLILKKSAHIMEDEIRADAYVPDEYKEDLITYFDNHVINSPERSKFIKTEEEYNNEQKTACVFSRRVIFNVKTRRNVLKTAFKQQYDTDESPYLKKFVKWLGNDVFGYDVEADLTNTVYESSVMRCFERDEAECTAKANAIMENSDVTARDISILQVQANTIETTDQKMFVVHTIYDYIETIQNKKDKILKKCNGDVDEAKKYTRTYDEQLASLNDTLRKVMNIDTSGGNRKYGLFVKYPKGYEG